MRIINSFYIREIAGETIAIPIGDAVQKFSGIIGLNDVSRFLFERLMTEQSEETLVSALCDEYDVDEITARNDIIKFIEQLKFQGILED